MRLEPLFDRVVLERDAPEKIGNILLPDDMQRKHAPLRARVVALGPSCEAGLVEGDEVMISPYGGKWLNERGDPTESPEEAKHYIIKEEDILARILPERPLLKEVGDG